jgi:hypothetical protein
LFRRACVIRAERGVAADRGAILVCGLVESAWPARRLDLAFDNMMVRDEPL